MRPYLVFCSVGRDGAVPELFGEEREFDVALHVYDDNCPKIGEPEYQWEREGEKLNVAATLLPGIYEQYKAVAFLDDDLTVSTDQLNRLFHIPENLPYVQMWQPSLSRSSFVSWSHLITTPEWETAFLTMCATGCTSPIRCVPFVEIMCPFFTREIMPEVMKTLDINQSGWGLDCFIWPKIAAAYVIDNIAIGHYRPPARRERLLQNGLTCQQELWIQQIIYDPNTAPVNPPGYKRPLDENYV